MDIKEGIKQEIFSFISFYNSYQHFRDHACFPGVHASDERAQIVRDRWRDNCCCRTEAGHLHKNNFVSTWSSLNESMESTEKRRSTPIRRVHHLNLKTFPSYWTLADGWLQGYTPCTRMNQYLFLLDCIMLTTNTDLSKKNPHKTRETNFQHRFQINEWCGVSSDLTGPHIFIIQLSGEAYDNLSPFPHSRTVRESAPNCPELTL